MALVEPNAHLAELALLDIVDVMEDGTLMLNEEFVDACTRVLDKDPSRFDTVIQEHILARALERGYAGCFDVDGMALTALELGNAVAEAAEWDARA